MSPQFMDEITTLLPPRDGSFSYKMEKELDLVLHT